LGSAQPIRVIGRQALGAGATLMLVEVDGQRMLISVSRGGVSLLERKANESSNVVPFDPSFSATLKRAGPRW
jgi:flagellar biogenesis protein FliO